MKITPAQIAEQAIGMFIERIEAMDGGIAADMETIERAIAQAVIEVVEGTGTVLPDDCPHCSGTGLVQSECEGCCGSGKREGICPHCGKALKPGEICDGFFYQCDCGQ